MFDFYTAAQRQERTGQRVTVLRAGYRLKNRIVAGVLLLLWGSMLVIAGGCAHQLWRLWFVPVQQSDANEEAPFKLATQHYFFKKQPLPEMVVEPDEAEPIDDEEEISDEPIESSVNEGEGAGKDELRERVKKAIEALNQ